MIKQRQNPSVFRPSTSLGNHSRSTKAFLSHSDLSIFEALIKKNNDGQVITHHYSFKLAITNLT